ncbi:hypothetical protein DUU79_22175 [Salmonella enterica subsp. enterica serovar Goldcoast]|nr:hypothetical protein [Salmonella enterica subsp. enterica serovar Goldcoast]EBY1295223.1 hypothetical protein [Salmonella enterica subsp. enterica serovar Goldcoast]EDY0578669.1 hypothetical protein [Salmonella enterica subsp. enterica serovar Goldcoast]
MTEEQKRIERAIELVYRYGGTDEMHHLQWVVDQMGVSLDIENYCTIRASPACQRRCLWFLSALQ